MIVDTHQHNWQIARFPYPWITPGDTLARDYMPADALPLMHGVNVTSCVLVEAGASAQAEITWMLELAQRHPHISGVVGKIEDMRQAEHVIHQIDSAQRAHLKGVRINCFEGEDWDAYAVGLRALAIHHLTCDVLVGRGMLPLVVAMMTANPDVTFVLDHLAGTRVAPDGYAAWQEALRPAAALPNVVMKLSGYLTSADPQPLDARTLEPYVEIALELFGARRLMYGSDWPVCTLGGTYADTVNCLKPMVDRLSPDEQSAIWHRTAIRTYRLNTERIH